MSTSKLRALPVFAAGEIEIPFVIAGMDEFVSEDTTWKPHSHPTHELLWNERGISTAVIGSRAWTISPQVGLWIPAGVVHVGHAPAGTWYRTAHFGIHAVESLSEEPVAVDISPLLRLLLERLADESLGEASRVLTERMVRDVLTPSEGSLVVQMPSSELLRPIASALVADPGDRRTLSRWAELSEVSERTITRAFRSETGLGFSDWLAAVRSQRAAMLLGSGVELEEVADRVGYSSVSAFGAAFRRTTGMTPGQIRPSR